MLDGIDKSKSYTGFQQRNSVMPEGITKKESHYAQNLFSNPEMVDQVKDDCIEQNRERNKEIFALWLAYYSGRDIAEKLEIDHKTVGNIIGKMGKKLHMQGIPQSFQPQIYDVWNFHKATNEEMYSQALDATDYEYQTLRDAKWVSNKIQLSLRKDNLIKWDKLKYRIETCKDIIELSKLSPILDAVQQWGKQSRQSKKTQDTIGAYRIDLERKRGEWIKENIPEEGLLLRGQKRPRDNPTLKDAGIGHHESPKLRALADIPDEIIEEFKTKVKILFNHFRHLDLCQIKHIKKCILGA